MDKKQQFDVFKYIPIAIMAVSLVSGFTLLQARVTTAESKIEEVADDAEEAKTETESLKVIQATQTAKLDAIYEVIKDIRNNQKK